MSAMGPLAAVCERCAAVKRLPRLLLSFVPSVLQAASYKARDSAVHFRKNELDIACEAADSTLRQYSARAGLEIDL